MGGEAPKGDSERPVAVCVLGPGRAGTSLTARLLGLGGVYLGPESELLTRTGIPANPKGFWEHRGLARINQRVLGRLGGSWSEPPPLPPGWERGEELAPERADAGALLERTFGERRLWGWKDSRNSLTLPFWRRLLPAERYDLRYVICLRNPLEVAASLTPPRPFSQREAIELWATYVAHALVNTSGRPRLLMPYADYFRDWRGAVERLLRFAGGASPTPGGEVESRMREFVDRRLWRHRAEPADAVRAPVPEAVRSLYLIAELLATGEPQPGLIDAVDRYAQALLGGDVSA